MLFWIYDVPSGTLAFLFALIFVGFTWLGTISLRPFLRMFVRNQVGLNDLVGYVLGAYGVFYGLLLGLLAVAAYQNYSDVEKSVLQESACLAALYRDVSSFPEPIRAELQGHIRKYTRHVIDEAWPQQRKGVVPRGGVVLISNLQNSLTSFEPTSPREEVLFAEALSQFNAYVELRVLRLRTVNRGIPPILWYVVLMGAVMNIVIIWLFEMRLLVHLVLGGMLAFFIGMVIFLIAAMDYPYRGEVSITAEPFEQVYQNLMKPGG